MLLLRPNHQRVSVLDRTFVVQVYRNLEGPEGGYASQYLLRPLVNTWEGFIDPVVKFRHSLLRAFQDERQGGRWCIDQSSHVLCGMPCITAANW